MEFRRVERADFPLLARWLAAARGPVLVQRSLVAAYRENLDDLSSLAPVPDQAVTLDHLVGDPAGHGRGLGSSTTRCTTSPG